MRKLYLLCLIILFGSLSTKAQSILLKGNVFGFLGDRLTLIRKAQKNVNFEGPISNVKITLSQDGKVIKSLTTNATGEFNFYITDKGEYSLLFEENNYSTVTLDLDIGTFTRLSGNLYILLKRDEKDAFHLGQLKFDNNTVNFTENSKLKNPEKSDLVSSNFQMIDKFLTITNNGLVKSSPITQKVVANLDSSSIAPVQKMTIENELKKQISTYNFNQNNADLLRSAIEQARKDLQLLDTNSFEFHYLSQQIEIAEARLKDKDALINTQSEVIASKSAKLRYFVYFISAILILLAGILFYLYRTKRFNNLLEEKNRKIVHYNSNLLSSIRYAALIQNSFLPSNLKVKQIFSNLFIYNRPKDVLSGDFYWFSERKDMKVVVVADCTGHGVPGALLTVLGHSALNDIVNNKGIVNPSGIILALNASICDLLSANKGDLDFGMDLTVIVYDAKTSTIDYSGLANGFYHRQEGKMRYVNVNPKGVTDDLTAEELTYPKIKIAKNDAVFLFTDGYVDQFSANENSIEKLNLSRFEKILDSISVISNEKVAHSTLDKELIAWKKNREQLDDILIVGIQF